MKNILTLALLLALANVLLKEVKCESLGGEKEHGFKFSSPNPKYYTKYNSQFKAIGDASNANLLRVQELLQKVGEDLETANGIPSAEQGPENQSFNFLINSMSAKTLLNCSSESLQGKQRTHNGTCNNMQNPRWGSALTTFARIYPPSYQDKFNEPCGGLISTLPNPRVISRVMHPDLNIPDVFLTNMVPQIGQFLDHDMTLTPQAESDCCGPERETNPDCFPIDIPVNDTFYASVGQTCMSFTRSTPFFFPGVTPTREQMNGISAFVDASQVYSSNSTLTNLLREHSGGRLHVNERTPSFLPTVEQLRKIILEELEIFGTFAAGDPRVNEMPGLTALHTLMMREHNRLTKDFENLRPDWSDEEIFQAARRLLIAQWQKIIYKDYLPVILGNNAMEQYNLKIRSGTYSDYDPSVDPTIFSAFSTAAYRFGHSLIPGLIRMMQGPVEVDTYQIRNNYFDSSKITFSEGQGYDFILGGLMRQNPESFDRFISDDVCNFLERKPENNFGSDLIARNIQRGRDHGLQPYSSYRQHCNLEPLTTWGKRPAEIPVESWNLLESLYESPLDIDLFPAGLAETAVPGAVTGPTFNCLMAEQFRSLKFGDRFFYTHQGQVGSFTLPQLAEINARTLGDVICQNSNTEGTQKNVFRPSTSYNRLASNPWISCNDTNNRQFLDVAQFL